MQNLLAFLAQHFHWIVFLLLEAASAVMLFSYNSYQGSVWLSSANAVTGKVYEWQAEVTQFFTLTRRSQELSQRNLFLEQEVGRLRRELAQTAKDSTDMERQTAAQLSSFQLIPPRWWPTAWTVTTT